MGKEWIFLHNMPIEEIKLAISEQYLEDKRLGMPIGTLMHPEQELLRNGYLGVYGDKSTKPFAICDKHDGKLLYLSKTTDTFGEAVALAVIEGVCLWSADFRYRDLSGLCLQRGSFDHADFSHALLDNTDFTDASLAEADLTGVSANNTIFTRAKLINAKFDLTHLSTYANIQGAIISNSTNELGVYMLTPEQARKINSKGAKNERRT